MTNRHSNFTSSDTGISSVRLTAFNTSNKTAAVWYAFVSWALGQHKMLISVFSIAIKKKLVQFTHNCVI